METICWWHHWASEWRVSRLGFVTAATSFTGGQPNFAGYLAISWAATLHIHFRGFLPRRNFARCCQIEFTSKSCVLLYWQRYCAALQQRVSAKLCGMVQGMELWNFHRCCHLYLAGRPSRWALALVKFEQHEMFFTEIRKNITPYDHY